MRLAWLAIILAAAAVGTVFAFGVGRASAPAGVADAAPAGPAASEPPATPGARTAPASDAAPAPSATPAPAPAATPEPAQAEPALRPATNEPIVWRRSQAVGVHHDGALRDGVQLPSGGRDFFTWDPVAKTIPNPGWRRWGTARLVRSIVRTLRRYRTAHPEAPRVGIGDLSRPHGGDFGARFGNLGHVSHQNGLDADLYYPREDRRERRPHRPGLVDRELAQELVDAFVAAGASKVFVGPRLDLHGPPAVVQPLVHHDDHLHVRFR